jgi:hypothetical protein
MRAQIFATVVILTLSASPVLAQQEAGADRDAAAPVEPLGSQTSAATLTGATTLTVTAPRDLCADAAMTLEVSRFAWDYAFGGVVLRAHERSADCRWTFDDVREGQYIAVLKSGPSQRIVAAARGEVEQGATEALILSRVKTAPVNTTAVRPAEAHTARRK